MSTRTRTDPMWGGRPRPPCRAEARPRAAAPHQALQLILIFLVAFAAEGKIEKFARPGTKGLDLVWWPRLPAIEGWNHNDDASWQMGVNMLVPAGESFANAGAVMYGNAVYKPRTGAKNLARFIADDKAAARERVPGVHIVDLPPMLDADGRSHPTVSFTPPAQGDREIIAYGEERDFYLVFAVSAHGEAALRLAMPSFRKLVSRYHR